MTRSVELFNVARRLAVLVFAAALVLTAATSGAWAQTQFGTITGRVQDSSGAVIAGAKVVLTNVATNTRQEVTTTDDGIYLFANVAAGDYQIGVEKESFKRGTRRVTLTVAQRLALDITLEVGQVTETITVSEQAVAVNAASGELSKVITPTELVSLPLLTRNPYDLVALSAGAVVTGGLSGDTRGGSLGDTNSGGVAVNGGRTSSINYMLDGGENNDTFATGVGQPVPLDAVQEFRVQTNNMTAEFGRNAVVTNVITKSGSNAFHGSAYEYYRGAALSTTPFDDKAKGVPKSNFVRNQFGASAGGPIIRDKTFFFGSFEGLRVRSSSAVNFLVPTDEFLANSSADTAAFLNAFGALPAGDPNNCLTAQQIVEDVEGGGAGSYASNPLINPTTGAPIPAATNLFCRSTVTAPQDAGAGLAQNTWLWTARIDHQFSERTSLLGRYAFSQNRFPVGSNSVSPFEAFNTGIEARSQNLSLTLTHSFSPRFFSESRFVYNRFLQNQPLGDAPETAPCWNYLNSFNTPTGEQIVFPGYIPAFCAFASIPFGGPQNIYQAYEGATYLKGKHTIKFGGQYLHLRDNRTFGALANAFIRTNTIQGFLDGTIDRIQVAIDPRGKVPGDIYDVNVDGEFQAPSFTRHYRYNETALYVDDSWKLTDRLTVSAGMRWEYFGVLHSPGPERLLDANLFLDAVGSTTPLVSSKTIFEQVRDARFARTNNLYQQDWNNFAPRVGFAWNFLGDNRTVLRGGYGVFYDRNFGNALFNVIQNFPNYAVVVLQGNAIGPIEANQFGTLEAIGGAALAITGSSRMLDRELVTAYSQQWNLTLEHDILGKGVVASLSYVGSRGDKLYSLNNLNPIGGCLRAPSINAVCDPTTPGRTSRLNQTGLSGMNRRGNEGFSRYHGLSFDVRSARIANTGLLVAGNYTWSHAIDNSSSFFGDSLFEGFFGFGFRDAYNPGLDRASSSNDIRHRMTLSWNWQIPFAKSLNGWRAQVLDGWQISGIFQAQTGVPFTVYDGSGNATCSGFDGTNFCLPLQTGALPSRQLTPDGPNSFIIYDVSSTFQNQEDFCTSNSVVAPGVGTFGNDDPGTGQNIACTAALFNLFPQMLSGRNLLRTPGIWNMDTAILKDFRLPWEGKQLQFRAEFFNLFNHSNVYVVAGTNQFIGAGSVVTAARGLTNAGGKERRNIQLALRFTW